MKTTLIYQPGGNGQAAFPATRQAPIRRYKIVNGVVTLAGYADDILHADAAELLKDANYRMPTPLEQEQMTQAEQQQSRVQESTELSGTEQTDELSASAEQNTAPTEPPALDNASGKKKASGG